MKLLMLLIVMCLNIFIACGNSSSNILAVDDSDSSSSPFRLLSSSSSNDIFDTDLDISSSSLFSSSSRFSSSSSLIYVDPEVMTPNSQDCEYSVMLNTLECVDATYKTITIGTQTWMAENLNYNSGLGSYCYDDNSDNCSTYGRLYNWNIALNIDESYQSSSWTNLDGSENQGICPNDWHLPSSDEWSILFEYAENQNRLKAEDGWLDAITDPEDTTDPYGFSALPGGYRMYTGDYDDLNNEAYWWSATEANNYNAFGHSITTIALATSLTVSSKEYAYSVRCLKD